GTIVPAYALNSILGIVPIIGPALLGGEGQGLFAANYQVTGSAADPQVSVNPLSAFVPGLLRRLIGDAVNVASRLEAVNKRYGTEILIGEDAIAIRGDDLPSQIFVERCRKYLASPPPEDWTAVSILAEK